MALTDEEGLIETVVEPVGVRAHTTNRSFALKMEFPLFLVMMSLSLAGAAVINIVLYRTCVHELHYDKSICEIFLVPHKTNQSSGMEKEVLKYASFVTTTKTVIESFVPAIFSLFLGVWSDTYGRKPLIVWPLFGMSISAILTVVYSMMDSLGPWWFILTVIPFSLTGGYSAIFTGAFCYLNDVTPKDKISLRMTILESAVSVGSVIGSVSVSHMMAAIGNTYTILVAAVLLVLAYAYTNVFVEESLNGALKGGLSSILDWLLVREMITECFKERPNHERAQILLLTLANCLSVFLLYGIMGFEYIYTRQQLNWSIKEYTTFSATSTTIAFVGGFLGILIFQKCCKINDLFLAGIAFLSGGVEYMIRAFAVTSWQMYFGAFISLFKGLSSPLIRSLMTKIVPVEDIAKVFALSCAIEAISPLVSPPLYNSVYVATQTVFPGAIYVLSGFITMISLVFLAIVQCLRWKSNNRYHILTQDNVST